MNPFGFFFIAGGAFAMAGATFNWDWFMNGRKARFMVSMLGRNGARWFYGTLGLALMVFGVLAIMNIIDVTQ